MRSLALARDDCDLWFWRRARLCGFAGFGWRTTCGCAARKIFVGGDCQYVGFSERIWMVGQLFAQRRNLLSRHRAGIVPPLTSLVCENVGNFLVSQCFIPRLHHSCTEFLALYGDRTCQ